MTRWTGSTLPTSHAGRPRFTRNNPEPGPSVASFPRQAFRQTAWPRPRFPSRPASISQTRPASPGSRSGVFPPITCSDVGALEGGNHGACLLGNLQAAQLEDSVEPAIGPAFFNLVSAMDENGERAATRDSMGLEHAPDIACRPARRIFALTPNTSQECVRVIDALRKRPRRMPQDRRPGRGFAAPENDCFGITRTHSYGRFVAGTAAARSFHVWRPPMRPSGPGAMPSSLAPAA